MTPSTPPFRRLLRLAAAAALIVAATAPDRGAAAAADGAGPSCAIDLERLIGWFGSELPAGPRPRTLRWEGALPSPRHASDHRLAGRAAVDLRITGTAPAPEVSGTARIVDGVYEHRLAGTLIDRLTIAFDATGGDRIGFSLTGRDGRAGSVVGGGSVAVRPDGSVAIDASALLTDVTLLRRDDVVAIASGAIGYRGTPCRGRLEGRLEATTVDVRLPDPLPASVVEIDVVTIGDAPGPQRRGNDGVPADRWSVDLDLDIDLPGRVVVRGRGIESEWTGSVVVSGDGAQPRLRGVLDLVRGHLAFVGRTFVIGTGSAVFEHEAERAPLVDLAASHENGEFTAQVSLSGSAATPTITLTSKPALPEEEILSRLMFGRSVARLTPPQLAQLAEAGEAVRRGELPSANRWGVWRTLRGIDILAVERARRQSEGGVRHRGAGSQLDDEVAGEGVQIEIAPGISVAAEHRDDEALSEGTLGLIWKWDY